MRCSDWHRLLNRYRRAVGYYREAVDALGYLSDGEFNEAWHRSERARKNAESARADLLDHEHVHGCFSEIETEELVLGDQCQSGG